MGTLPFFPAPCAQGDWQGQEAASGGARTFVSKYELGERTLSFPEVLELCRWLQLDGQEFIGLVKGDIPAPASASGFASASGPKLQEAEPTGDKGLAAAGPHEESGGKGPHS